MSKTTWTLTLSKVYEEDGEPQVSEATLAVTDEQVKKYRSGLLLSEAVQKLYKDIERSSQFAS